MARKIPERRKQRTRQHVIADLSVHHVERFILESGHTCQRLGSDYGYDLLMTTFDEQGYIEEGFVYFQFKATESLRASGPDFVYDVDVRDYNLWVSEQMPVVLVLYDASRRRAYWVAVKQYFHGAKTERRKQDASSIRVRVPKRQVINRRGIALMRELKSLPMLRIAESES